MYLGKCGEKTCHRKIVDLIDLAKAAAVLVFGGHVKDHNYSVVIKESLQYDTVSFHYKMVFGLLFCLVYINVIMVHFES